MRLVSFFVYVLCPSGKWIDSYFRASSIRALEKTLKKRQALEAWIEMFDGTMTRIL